jgi:hypothetical protein
LLCRPRHRMEALHRLNLNPVLAQIPRLMELVICGEASYEDAKPAYLLTYRAPFFESDVIAEQMNRAEYLSVLQGGGRPFRLQFVPSKRRSYAGEAFPNGTWLSPHLAHLS